MKFKAVLSTIVDRKNRGFPAARFSFRRQRKSEGGAPAFRALDANGTVHFFNEFLHEQQA